MFDRMQSIAHRMVVWQPFADLLIGAHETATARSLQLRKIQQNATAIYCLMRPRDADYPRWQVAGASFEISVVPHEGVVTGKDWISGTVQRHMMEDIIGFRVRVERIHPSRDDSGRAGGPSYSRNAPLAAWCHSSSPMT